MCPKTFVRTRRIQDIMPIGIDIPVACRCVQDLDIGTQCVQHIEARRHTSPRSHDSSRWHRAYQSCPSLTIRQSPIGVCIPVQDIDIETYDDASKTLRRLSSTYQSHVDVSSVVDIPVRDLTTRAGGVDIPVACRRHRPRDLDITSRAAKTWTSILPRLGLVDAQCNQDLDLTSCMSTP